jgi:putative protein-disulfide isomerase
VIGAIEESYKDRLKFELMLGGLRPGTTEPVMPKFREEILHHWHEVHRRTGQTFVFEAAMPDGFIYNTEPPSRAVVTVSEINPTATFPYFKSVQQAFYAERQDVTKPETLAALAQRQDIESAKFLERFHSDDVKKKTQMNFYQVQQAGITGFPTVALQNDSGAQLLMVGYQPFEELKPKIDAWLAENH